MRLVKGCRGYMVDRFKTGGCDLKKFFSLIFQGIKRVINWFTALVLCTYVDVM